MQKEGRKKWKKMFTRILAGIMSVSMAVPAAPIRAAAQTGTLQAARSNAGEVTEILPCEDVYTVNGVKLVLPDKVKVKIGEEEGERDVVWNLAGKSFSGDSGKVTVEGTVAGSDQKATL